VDLYTVAAGYSPKRVFSLAHDALPPNAVLCGKLIAALWLITGQVVYQRVDAVPFAGIAAGFAQGALWTRFALLVQLLAILTILCSRFFRTGCACLGVIIVGLSALDQPSFSNNRAFCAAVLIMLALDARAALARAQIALVYGCAATDKLLTADWRSGWFLRTFTDDLCRVGELWSPGWSQGAALPLTCTLSRGMLQSPSFALACSGLVIGTELAIAVGYATHARFTAPAALSFHCLLFAFTGSTFGVFFYAGAACSVLVLALERQPAPFDRGWPYFALAVLLAGPWVRPWFAVGLLMLVLALCARHWRPQRPHIAQ
jgi:hypothetical protein